MSETVATLRKRWLAAMIGNARFAAATRELEGAGQPGPADTGPDPATASDAAVF